MAMAGSGFAHRLKRWIYRGDRPDSIAKALNRFWGNRYRSGGPLARSRDVELEITGRSTGRTVAFPIVLADYDGATYAVSMLGARANWVLNLQAADGRAILRHGAAVPVRLVEVPAAQRPPILRRYLQVAPGARPHIPVARSAPVDDFAAIAADYPVFRVEGFALD